MSEVPSLDYSRVINTLQRAGFVVVRQRGSHIRLQKRLKDKLLKITVPAHKPIKKSTLIKITLSKNTKNVLFVSIIAQNSV